MTIETLLTPRIEACLACGDLDHLFPVLATWSQEEIRLLRDDLNRSYHMARERIEHQYHRDCFAPEYLFSPLGRELIDLHYREDCLRLLEVYGELASVVQFYLKPEPTEPEAAQ